MIEAISSPSKVNTSWWPNAPATPARAATPRRRPPGGSSRTPWAATRAAAQPAPRRSPCRRNRDRPANGPPATPIGSRASTVSTPAPATTREQPSPELRSCHRAPLSRSLPGKTKPYFAKNRSSGGDWARRRTRRAVGPRSSQPMRCRSGLCIGRDQRVAAERGDLGRQRQRIGDDAALRGPEVANCAACETFSPNTSFGLIASQSPAAAPPPRECHRAHARDWRWRIS